MKDEEKKVLTLPIDVEFEPIEEEKKYPYNWKYAEAGINPEDFKDPLPEGKLMIYQDFITGFPMNKFMKEYVELIKGTRIPQNFFSEEDGRIAKYVDQFFDAEFGTPDGELAVFNLQYYCNKLCRKILHKKNNKPKIDISLNYNFFGSDDSDTMSSYDMKELAWFVMHSYITGIFLTPEQVYECMNEMYDYMAEEWNKYILAQDDVPNEVKDIFFINFSSMPISKYFEMYTLSKGFTEIPGEPKALAPTDDPVVSDADTIHTITLDAAKEKATEELHIELNEQFKEAVKNDTKEEKKESTPTPKKEKPKKAPSALIINDEKKKEPEKEKEKKASTKIPIYIGKQNPEPAKPEENKIITPPTIQESSHDIELRVPGLRGLTELAGKFMFSITYYPANDVGFPGLILGKVSNNTKPDSIREIIIDPQVLYGDYVRLIPNVPKDIRIAVAIPIYDEPMIMKAISGNLTDADIAKINSEIPAVLRTVKDGEYAFLDRIDLRNIQTSTGKGMSLRKWQSLIQHINRIIEHPSIPKNVRFTVFNNTELKDHEDTEFCLVCNEQTISSFYTKILAEDEHRKYASAGTVIDYSETKYPAPFFNIGYINQQ